MDNQLLKKIEQAKLAGKVALVIGGHISTEEIQKLTKLGYVVDLIGENVKNTIITF